jgi:hypothetical protein
MSSFNASNVVIPHEGNDNARTHINVYALQNDSTACHEVSLKYQGRDPTRDYLISD